jgi:hypothetical protein
MNARHLGSWAIGLLVALGPTTARGQFARLRGRVFDSVTALPLAGARVQLVNADDRAQKLVSTTSDSLGQFVLDSVARGRYIAGFLHPMLDSLGLVLAQRLVTVSDQQDVRFELAVPGPERVEKALCGQQTDKDSTGAILGYVLNAHTLTPDSATLVVQWAEFSVGQSGVSHRVLSQTAVTAPGGWFAVCGVPIETSVILRAVSGPDTTGPIQVDVPKSRIARHNLYIDRLAAVASAHDSETAPVAVVAPTVDTVPASHAHRNALVSGWVRTEDGVPIQGARVSLYGNEVVAVTNDSGAFQLSGVPGGSQTLITRAIGFVPDERAVDLTDRHLPVIVGLLSIRRFLDTIHVKAARTSVTNAVGFDDRRRLGSGKFFTARDVERLHPDVLTDLFRHAPSLSLSVDNNNSVKIRMRGDQGACTPAIFLDGKQLIEWELADLNSLVTPDQLAGVEVYTPALTPAEFRTKVGCGTVVVWTRSNERPPR